MTTEEMKALYEANPDNWICVIKLRSYDGWEKSYVKASNWDMTIIHRKLIHIKHKKVLEAWLADNSVEIEYLKRIRTSELYADYTNKLVKVNNFIENYNPDLEYRLKEKEDGKYKIHDKNPMDTINSNSNSSGDKLLLNNFQDYGFTASFEGEILKEYNDCFIGGVKNTISGYMMEEKWNKSGESKHHKQWNLTPIKRPWYENPENFPALVTKDGKTFQVWQDHYFERMLKPMKEDLKNGWRLATKSELLSLYVEEDND